VTSPRTARNALIVARIALGIGIAALAVVTARALGEDPRMNEQPVAGFAPIESAAFGSALSIRVPRANRFSSSDPFSPTRDASGAPYRLGREVTGERPFETDARQLRVLGTVVGRDRSFALCELAGAAVRAVYPGQRIGSFTLLEVQQGRAVFRTDAGERVVLNISRTGR
jgi:hypothetical protein